MTLRCGFVAVVGDDRRRLHQQGGVAQYLIRAVEDPSDDEARANMILAAALVEGAAFFAMVIGLLVVLIK